MRIVPHGAAAQVGQVVAIIFILYGTTGSLWEQILAACGWPSSVGSCWMRRAAATSRSGSWLDCVDTASPTSWNGTAPVWEVIDIRDFVGEYLLHSGNRCFVVMQDHHAAGIVTANDARKVNRDAWNQRSVQSVMRPLNRMLTVTPEMPVLKALELMTSQKAEEERCFPRATCKESFRGRR